jgi:hypothetical protein
MAIEDGEQRSLEKTPTWAVSICCFIVLVISLIIDGGLHKLAEVSIIIIIIVKIHL